MNNTQDKNNPEETKDLDYYLGHIRYDMTNLIKWLVHRSTDRSDRRLYQQPFCKGTQICHKLPGRKHMDLFPAATIRSGDRISLSEIWA